jgi:hypothetical protein
MPPHTPTPAHAPYPEPLDAYPPPPAPHATIPPAPHAPTTDPDTRTRCPPPTMLPNPPPHSHTDPTTPPTTAPRPHTPDPTTPQSPNADPPRQYTNTTAFRCERMRRISAPPTKLCIKRRVEPYSCAIHQHHRRRKRRVGDLLGDALRCQPTQQRVPAFVRNGLQAVQQGAQSGHRLVRQSFWGEAKEQLAIRGASGSAQQGEGEDEGFGVEGLACFGVRAWMVLGELQDGVIDGACGQGAARDGSVLAFRWVEWTQPHSYFRTPSTPLDKP